MLSHPHASRLWEGFLNPRLRAYLLFFHRLHSTPSHPLLMHTQALPHLHLPLPPHFASPLLPPHSPLMHFMHPVTDMGHALCDGHVQKLQQPQHRGRIFQGGEQMEAQGRAGIGEERQGLDRLHQLLLWGEGTGNDECMGQTDLHHIGLPSNLHLQRAKSVVNKYGCLAEPIPLTTHVTSTLGTEWVRYEMHGDAYLDEVCAVCMAACCVHHMQSGVLGWRSTSAHAGHQN